MTTLESEHIYAIKSQKTNKYILEYTRGNYGTTGMCRTYEDANSLVNYLYNHGDFSRYDNELTIVKLV